MIFEITKTSSSKVWSRQKNQRENIILENNIIFYIVPTIFLISVNILFSLFSYLFCTKRIFSLWFFTFITLWKTMMTFSWFQRLIEGYKWFIPEWPYCMAKNACSSSFVVYRTCKEIWWSYLWIFSLKFFFMDFSYFFEFFFI